MATSKILGFVLRDLVIGTTSDNRIRLGVRDVGRTMCASPEPQDVTMQCLVATVNHCMKFQQKNGKPVQIKNVKGLTYEITVKEMTNYAPDPVET